MTANSRKGQTTIEYLLLISVVVLIFVGVLVTVNELRKQAEQPVNVSGEEQTPTEAIGNQLNDLRNVGGGGSTTPTLHLSISMEPQLPCAFEPITVTVTNENGPVADAAVTISEGTTVIDTKSTASDGVVIFSPQAMSSYTLNAEKTGNEPASLQFTVAC